MKDEKYGISSKFHRFIRKKCIILIKEQVDIFFSGCFKALKSYSILVSNNLKMHNKENFEAMVLSMEEINSFIDNVEKMLALEIESSINDYVDIELNVEVNHLNLDKVSDFVDCLHITNEITKMSEKLINKSFCSLVGSLTKMLL
ncbi:hypothetical protein PL321_07360 [Caloramator sp. mosi_1]|uniref:hypothetical protein n=1 Tax=Caloramator sp. mosi_1 TaxID=3023090 RepID=UPI00235EE922|nr:hypothetical protein [Caloramator sp. mosi_1]WDC85261.1 hypothetical protein PL321_07360 [Caloramator sp. mosi_1]